MKIPSSPIALSCEIVSRLCGQECHCELEQYCLHHQDPDGDETWPCDAQLAFEKTPEYRLDMLERDNAILRKSLQQAIEAGLEHAKETARLTRIVEHALVPFMRDALPHIGGTLQISANVGDAPSLLGYDADTFNRGGGWRRKTGITYTASTGQVWHDGEPEPRSLITKLQQERRKPKRKKIK